MKRRPTNKIILSSQESDEDTDYVPNRILKRLNTRKFGYCADTLAENFCLIFGSEPAKTVLSDTTMVKDLTDLLETDYDKERLAIRIPDALDHLKGKDAKFEMVKSNSL